MRLALLAFKHFAETGNTWNFQTENCGNFQFAMSPAVRGE